MSNSFPLKLRIPTRLEPDISYRRTLRRVRTGDLDDWMMMIIGWGLMVVMKVGEILYRVIFTKQKTQLHEATIFVVQSRLLSHHWRFHSPQQRAIPKNLRIDNYIDLNTSKQISS